MLHMGSMLEHHLSMRTLYGVSAKATFLNKPWQRFFDQYGIMASELWDDEHDDVSADSKVPSASSRWG